MKLMRRRPLELDQIDKVRVWLDDTTHRKAAMKLFFACKHWRNCFVKVVLETIHEKAEE